MVVPFAPGGGSDVFGRTMQKGIEEVRPDVNVSVENRAGGSGSVGYSFFLQKKGDPHYLLPSETAAIALPLTTDTPWKWQDFTPVMQVAEDVSLLIVPADSPHKDLTSFVAAAKSKKLRMGLSGSAGTDAINTSLVERDQGVKFNRVVFESGGEMTTSLLGGDIDGGVLNPSEVIGQIEAGKVRAIAAFSEERYERAPLDTVPTAKEQGVNSSSTQYRGLFAPGGLTDAQRQYWEDTIVEWTKSESYDKYISSNYLRPVQRKHTEFVSYLKESEGEAKKVLARK